MRQSVSLYGGPIRGQVRTRNEVQMNPLTQKYSTLVSGIV